jgi:putative acetyltransferase
MNIQLDDLTGPEIHQLLQQHLQGMALHSPPESIHALDLDALRQPGITFWTVWDRGELLGCGALKELDDRHAEIKSMRTVSAHLRKGVAKAMLTHIVEEAKQRGYRRRRSSRRAVCMQRSASRFANRSRAMRWTRSASS